jgi:hypothetical protein
MSAIFTATDSPIVQSIIDDHDDKVRRAIASFHAKVRRDNHALYAEQRRKLGIIETPKSMLLDVLPKDFDHKDAFNSQKYFHFEHRALTCLRVVFGWTVPKKCYRVHRSYLEYDIDCYEVKVCGKTCFAEAPINFRRVDNDYSVNENGEFITLEGDSFGPLMRGSFDLREPGGLLVDLWHG